jgi:hypothetical protein
MDHFGSTKICTVFMLGLALITGFKLNSFGLKRGVAKKQHHMSAGFAGRLLDFHNSIIVANRPFWVNHKKTLQNEGFLAG